MTTVSPFSWNLDHKATVSWNRVIVEVIWHTSQQSPLNCRNSNQKFVFTRGWLLSESSIKVTYRSSLLNGYISIWRTLVRIRVGHRCCITSNALPLTLYLSFNHVKIECTVIAQCMRHVLLPHRTRGRRSRCWVSWKDWFAIRSIHCDGHKKTG